MNLLKWRALVSTLLVADFVPVALTGWGLYLAPSGKIARLTDWHFLIWDKYQLEKLHTLSGFVMIALVLVHLLLNWKLYFNELKSWLK